MDSTSSIPIVFSDSLQLLATNPNFDRSIVPSYLRTTFLEAGDGPKESDGERETWMKFVALQSLVNTGNFNKELAALVKELASSDVEHHIWLSNFITISLEQVKR